MKKANSNRDEVRQNNLSIPMTKEEKAAVREASAKTGLTMTSWARMVLTEKINQKGG
jgi:hypothetical protein